MVARLSLWGLLVLSACTAGGAGEGEGEGEGPTDAGPDGTDAGWLEGDPANVVGAFLVKMEAPADGDPGLTSVVGRVQDGPTPSVLVWDVDQLDGDCTLLIPRAPFCSPPCGAGIACVEDDTCQSYPTGHEVGTVSVSGFASVFSMEALNAIYQLPVGLTLPYPAWNAGAVVTFAASGSTAPGEGPVFSPAFVLTARGVDELVLLDAEYPLDAAIPLAITWIAPSVEQQSRIAVKIDISHHGGTRGKIECDSDDDGALSVSAALVGALLDLGVSGFPSLVVTRSSTGVSAIPAGQVQLVVSSAVERAVQIDGLLSCFSNDDCTPPATCTDDLVCR